MIKKQFLYCEATEGGLTTHLLHPDSYMPLYGWMTHGCKKYDRALLRWMARAEVGDYYNHRLGVMIRIKDDNIHD